MRRGAFVALAAFLATSPVAAQKSRQGCEGDSGGTVHGVAKDAITGAPLRQVPLVLRGAGCSAVSVEGGIFIFHHVPPGKYKLEVRSLFNYRKGPAVPVTVKDKAVSNVEFRVHPANDVLDCFDEPACAAIIKPDQPSLVGLTEAEKMREVAIRTAIALYHTNQAMAVCVADSSKTVVGAIGKRIPNTVSSPECGMSEPPKSLRGYLIVKATRQPASSYFSGKIRIIDADTFDADPQYYTAPLNAATWECRFARSGQAWVPKSCRMTVIS